MINTLSNDMYHKYQTEMYSSADVLLSLRTPYYQMPRFLWVDERYREMNCYSKCTYMFSFERHRLSVKNNWLDENGNYYIYFAREEIGNKLNLSKRQVDQAIKELVEYKLIKTVRQGQGKPNRIYLLKPSFLQVEKYDRPQVEAFDEVETKVTNFDSILFNNTEDNTEELVGYAIPGTESSESPIRGIKNPRYEESRNPDMRILESPIWGTSNNNRINNEFSNIKSVSPSVSQSYLLSRYDRAKPKDGQDKTDKTSRNTSMSIGQVPWPAEAEFKDITPANRINPTRSLETGNVPYQSFASCRDDQKNGQDKTDKTSRSTSMSIGQEPRPAEAEFKDTTLSNCINPTRSLVMGNVPYQSFASCRDDPKDGQDKTDKTSRNTSMPIGQEPRSAGTEFENITLADRINLTRSVVMDNISYQSFASRRADIRLVDEMVEIVMDTLFTPSQTIRIDREEKSHALVCSAFMKLDYDNIDYCIEKFKNYPEPVLRKKPFLRTMLYNSRLETDAHYTNEYAVGKWNDS